MKMSTQRILGLTLAVCSTMSLIILAYFVFTDRIESNGHARQVPQQVCASVDTVFFSPDRDSLIVVINKKKVAVALPK